MLRLSALYRFPLKSGIAEPMRQAELDSLGLAGDRRWMLVEEGTGRFFTQRAMPQMSQLSALWNATGGLTLRAPGFEALDVAVPQVTEGSLRGVTIWRDTLAKKRRDGSVHLWAGLRAWCMFRPNAHDGCPVATAPSMTRWVLPTAFRYC
jgi:uncharacterized protein YcbX